MSRPLIRHGFVGGVAPPRDGIVHPVGLALPDLGAATAPMIGRGPIGMVGPAVPGMSTRTSTARPVTQTVIPKVWMDSRMHYDRHIESLELLFAYNGIGEREGLAVTEPRVLKERCVLTLSQLNHLMFLKRQEAKLLIQSAYRELWRHDKLPSGMKPDPEIINDAFFQWDVPLDLESLRSEIMKDRIAKERRGIDPLVKDMLDMSMLAFPLRSPETGLRRMGSFMDGLRSSVPPVAGVLDEYQRRLDAHKEADALLLAKFAKTNAAWLDPVLIHDMVPFLGVTADTMRARDLPSAGTSYVRQHATTYVTRGPTDVRNIFGNDPQAGIRARRRTAAPSRALKRHQKLFIVLTTPPKWRPARADGRIDVFFPDIFAAPFVAPTRDDLLYRMDVAARGLASTMPTPRVDEMGLGAIHPYAHPYCYVSTRDGAPWGLRRACPVASTEPHSWFVGSIMYVEAGKELSDADYRLTCGIKNYHEDPTMAGVYKSRNNKRLMKVNVAH